MIVDIHTFCWNEEIRLPYFLRHYYPICRNMYIYDNGSNDKSEDIASKYSRVVWDKSLYGLGEINDITLREIKNTAWKKTSRDADWVVVCDIDEIVYHRVGLQKYMERATDRGYTILRPHGYDMVSTAIPTHEGMFYDDDEFKYGVKHDNGGRCDKQCIFSPKHIVDINYDFGAHYANPTGNVKVAYDVDLKLLHYKYLSRDYIVDRHMVCAQRMSDINKRSGWGAHYQNEADVQRTSFDKLLCERVKVL
mgnify:CR=1 FL=1